MLRPLWVGVDKVVLRKRRCRLQRDQGTAVNDFAARFRKVDPGAGVSVDVEPAEAMNRFPARGVQDLGISRRVLLDDRELDLGPNADFVVFDGHRQNFTRMF